MKPEHMVHMANQIAGFFSSYPREQAVDSIADHLKKFWEPRMRKQIVAYAKSGSHEELSPLALEGVMRLADLDAAKA